MSIVGRIRKQPFEALDCALDFQNVLAAGASIASITSVTAQDTLTGTDSTAAVLATSPPPAISGSQVQFRVQDGADGGRHLITVRIVASNGEQFESEVKLIIEEV